MFWLQRIHPHLARIIIIFAALWLGWMLWNSADQVIVYLDATNWKRGAAAMSLALLSLLMTAYMYTLLLRHASGKKVPFIEVVLVYFPSQIAKYLPGKIWGILYQAERMANTIHATHTWQVNIEIIVWSMAQALVVVCSLIAWQQAGITGALVMLVILCLSLFAAIRSGFASIGISWVTARFSQQDTPCPNKMTPMLVTRFLSILMLESVVYIMVWAALLPADTPLLQAWVIASAYLLAWITGMIIFVVPNGIFIRETSFITIGSSLGISQDMLLFYSIYARIFFMLSDLTAALLCWLVAFILPESPHNHIEKGVS